jgi:hypothetical protein
LLRFQLRIQTFIPHTVTTAINTQLFKFEDLVRSIAFREINRDGTNLLGLCKASLDIIDNVDLGCAAEKRRVSAKQADGPGTEDGDCFTGAEPREVETGPGCGPDVGDKQVGELV